MKHEEEKRILREREEIKEQQRNALSDADSKSFFEHRKWGIGFEFFLFEESATTVDSDTDNETDKLLGVQRNLQQKMSEEQQKDVQNVVRKNFY